MANVSVRKADKGRGIFVVDLVETGYGESKGWSGIKFWKRNEASQYQVSITGMEIRLRSLYLIRMDVGLLVMRPRGCWIEFITLSCLRVRIKNSLSIIKLSY